MHIRLYAPPTGTHYEDSAVSMKRLTLTLRSFSIRSFSSYPLISDSIDPFRSSVY
jgi:hypothetical protein